MEGLLIGRPPRPDDTGAGRGCEAPAIPPRQRFAGTDMGNKAVVSRFPLGSAYKRRRICCRGVRLIVFKRAPGRTSWPRDRCAATRKRRNRRPTRTSRKAELRPRRSRPARRRRVKARTARRPEALRGMVCPENRFPPPDQVRGHAFRDGALGIRKLPSAAQNASESIMMASPARRNAAKECCAVESDEPRHLLPRPTARFANISIKKHLHENCVACPARTDAGRTRRRRARDRRRTGLDRNLPDHQL